MAVQQVEASMGRTFQKEGKENEKERDEHAGGPTEVCTAGVGSPHEGRVGEKNGKVHQSKRVEDFSKVHTFSLS